MMVLRRSTLFVAVMSLAATGFADVLRLRNGHQISGFYEGGTARIVRFRTDSGVQEFDILTVSSVQITGTSSNVEPEKTAKTRPEPASSFGPDQEKLIREWFSRNGNSSNLPPGLAKRGGNLPPGLEKHIQRNGQLPPGLQKRVEPFPQDLVSQLPRIADRIRRVILGRRALMLDDQNTILDEFLLD